MEQTLECRLLKRHGGKWKSRALVFGSHDIRWDGKKKKKTLELTAIARVVESSASPNSILKNCGFALELYGGKTYFFCAASVRQKKELMTRVTETKAAADKEAKELKAKEAKERFEEERKQLEEERAKHEEMKREVALKEAARQERVRQEEEAARKKLEAERRELEEQQRAIRWEREQKAKQEAELMKKRAEEQQQQLEAARIAAQVQAMRLEREQRAKEEAEKLRKRRSEDERKLVASRTPPVAPPRRSAAPAALLCATVAVPIALSSEFDVVAWLEGDEGVNLQHIRATANCLVSIATDAEDDSVIVRIESRSAQDLAAGEKMARSLVDAATRNFNDWSDKRRLAAKGVASKRSTATANRASAAAAAAAALERQEQPKSGPFGNESTTTIELPLDTLSPEDDSATVILGNDRVQSISTRSNVAHSEREGNTVDDADRLLEDFLEDMQEDERQSQIVVTNEFIEADDLQEEMERELGERLARDVDEYM